MKGLPEGYSKEKLRRMDEELSRKITEVDCSKKEKEVRIVLAELLDYMINYEEGVKRIMGILEKTTEETIEWCRNNPRETGIPI